MQRLLIRLSIATFVLVILLVVKGVLPALDSRFYPSETPAYIPFPGDDFATYVRENEARIRSALFEHYYSKERWPFGGEYPLERVVQMRAPYEISPESDDCTSAEQGAGIGFLMIHGLTDSPYLLRPVADSLAEHFPCAIVRGLLNPGHATVPGDLLHVRLQDWQRVTRFGIESFRGLTSRLYIVGYSNGAPLALDYVEASPDDAMIAGLVLLSPGLQAANRTITLSPWLRYGLRWAARGMDRDAVKYDSLATNGAAEFYRLTRLIGSADFGVIDLPVIMVLSGDDTTVVADSTVSFFCDKVGSSNRQLIWYRSVLTGTSPSTNCDGMSVVEVETSDGRYLSHSHVSITVPPDDEHYGEDGNYAVCTAYADDDERLRACQSDASRTVYGENQLRGEDGLYEGHLVRRTSYNQLYDAMLERIVCFIELSC